MLREEATCWVIYTVNSGPISIWMKVGSPKSGMISVSRICATVEDLLFDVGKASIYPEVSNEEPLLFYWRHVSKACLPIIAGKGSLKLEDGEGRGSEVALGVDVWQKEHRAIIFGREVLKLGVRCESIGIGAEGMI